jgi:Prp8 binding protein
LFNLLSLFSDSKRPRNELALRDQQAHFPRTSRLEEPTMMLTGHGGEVFSVCTSNEFLATAGFDQQILLWNIFGECENFSTLKGHKGAVMEGKYFRIDKLLFIL